MSEQALTLHREQEVLLATAHRLVGLGSWSLDTATWTLELSEQTHQLLCLPPDKPRTLAFSEFLERVHVDDRQHLEDVASRAAAGQREFSYQYRLIAPGGECRFIRGIGEAQLDACGHACLLVGTIMDATEQEHLRTAVAVTEARLQAVVECPTFWIWEQDADLRFTLVTPGTNRPHLLGPELGQGRRRWEIPGAVPLCGSWDEHRERCEAREPFQNFEYRVGTGSGAHIVSSTGLPFYAADGRFLGYRGTAQDITSLKRAQADAAESQALARMAARLGRLGAFRVELASMTLTWSASFLRVRGRPERVVLAMDAALNLIHPDWRGAAARAFTFCAEQGTAFDIEARASLRRRVSVWVRLVGEAVHDADGNVSHIQGAVQDISRSKESSEALRRAHGELRTTLESVTDPFVLIGTDGRLKYVNGHAEALAGKPRDSLVGTPFVDAFPPFRDSAIEKHLRMVTAEGASRRFEAYSHSFNKWFRVVAYPSQQGLAVYLRDVTEDRQAKQALAESEERHRLLFTNSSEAILECRPDGTIVRANAAACKLFGRTEAALCGHSSLSLASHDQTRLASMVQRRAQTGSPRGHVTMQRADGSLFEAEVAASVYRTREGTILTTLVVRNVTDRLRAENKMLTINAQLSEQLQERTSSLEQANQELRNLALALADDLAAPLASVKDLVRTLQSPSGPREPQEQAAECGDIRASAERMEECVAALLSAAEISQAPLRVSLVDLTAMAKDVLGELQTRGPRRRVAIRVQEGLVAHGDAGLLRTLLQSLLRNAWDFTAGCEQTEIAFTLLSASAGELAYQVRGNATGGVIAQPSELVGSSGPGKQFSGRRIDWANAHRIISKHGGRLWANSAVAGGVGFSFTLAPNHADLLAN